MFRNLFEDGRSLLQPFLVFGEGRKVLGVYLTQKAVHHLPSFFATAQNEPGVRRSHHHHWAFSHERFGGDIGSIFPNHLPFSLFPTHENVAVGKISLQSVHATSKLNIVLIDGFKITFGQAQMMDGIDEIGLSQTV